MGVYNTQDKYIATCLRFKFPFDSQCLSEWACVLLFKRHCNHHLLSKVMLRITAFNSNPTLGQILMMDMTLSRPVNHREDTGTRGQTQKDRINEFRKTVDDKKIK